MPTTQNRRNFLIAGGTAGASLLAPSIGSLHANEARKSDEADESEISAPEDLMREHGLLNRILLIYEEGMRRLERGEHVSADLLQKPAKLVRTFVEDYHERLEEKFIFPKFEKKQKLVDLVATLKKQHDAGRTLTDQILRMTEPSEYSKRETRNRIIENCHAFIRMYRPHEAREDTVLFPTLYKVASAEDVKELGEQFEEQEHKLFGSDGFQENVGKVAEIEKQLGIYELGSFTPKV